MSCSTLLWYNHPEYNSLNFEQQGTTWTYTCTCNVQVCLLIYTTNLSDSETLRQGKKDRFY